MPENHPFPRPNFVHLADVAERPNILAKWERHRHRSAHWFVECVAEFVSTPHSCLYTRFRLTYVYLADRSVHLYIRW